MAGMVVGVVGLGLIGGSAAKAFKAAGADVLACDINEPIVSYAMLEGVVDGVLNAGNIASCNLLLLTATPKAVAGYLRENAAAIAPSTLVIDFCGTKCKVCELGFALAAEYGFTFIGGHPMAGSQYSGFKHSRPTLFKGAPMIVVPPVYDDMELLERVKQMLAPLEFKTFVVTTAEHHDRMIAYTSQLCHIVSNAFIKSPASRDHDGYSAGSFRDLTRVARLNEAMWTELFLNNKKPLLEELDLIINSLQEYREALQQDDAARLCNLLREGRIAKELSEG